MKLFVEKYLLQIKCILQQNVYKIINLRRSVSFRLPKIRPKIKNLINKKLCTNLTKKHIANKLTVAYVVSITSAFWRSH